MAAATNFLEEENKLLRAQIRQLIADNLELSAKLEYNYDPNKPVRKLTLQEILELNMGNLLKKYRISAKNIKSIYYSIMTSAATDPEPEFIDLTFDSNRMFTAFYFVDLEKEKEEQEKAESINVDPLSIPDDMPQLQQKYDIQKVLEQITDGASLKKDDAD